MTERDPWKLLGMTIITLGIYGIYWLVKTKEDMVNEGADIPSAWWIIVPLANIWWLWLWCEGIGHVTKDKTSPVLAFIAMVQLHIIGAMLMQHEINHKTNAKPKA